LKGAGRCRVGKKKWGSERHKIEKHGNNLQQLVSEEKTSAGRDEEKRIERVRRWDAL